MQIQFAYDASVANAPEGFKQALAIAASELGSVITSPGNVTIQVGYGTFNGAPLDPGTLAEGGPRNGTTLTYAQILAEMRANADSATDQSVLAALSSPTAATMAAGYYITPAQQQAWGLLSPTTAVVTGTIGIGTEYTYATGADRVVGTSQFDLIGIAEHEISHALGRIAGDGTQSLVTYTAPGTLATIGGTGYFSTDGGVTNLANFAPIGDVGDLANAGQPNNNFDYVTNAGTANLITPVDKTLIDAIGFSTSADAATKYQILDTTTKIAHYENGTAYDGPVAGLTNEIIMASTDNINVTSFQANSFIHTGSGQDGIDISATGGDNIVDAGTNSNFLTGGKGNDTFYVDDRNPSANIWSTIANFHTGDSATVWGVNASDFALQWLPDQGAAGFTGVDATFTAAGHPVAALTIAGYGLADLRDGALRIAYGHTADLPNLPGSDYMTVTGANHFGA